MQEVVGSIPTSSTISSRGFPMKTLHYWFLAVLLLGPALCRAQSDAVFVAPRELPGAAAGLSINYRGDVREAIAVVSLTVKADGSTADLQLVDGFYSQEIGQSILRRVSALRYAPATLGGVPTDYYGYTTVVRMSQNMGMVISPGFRREYDAVQALYQKGEYSVAEARVAQLIDTKIQSMFEFAFLNKALIPILARLDKPQEALRAARMATLRDGPRMEEKAATGTLIPKRASTWPWILPKDLLQAALRQHFALALQQGYLSEALEVQATLHSIEPLRDDDPVTVQSRAAQEQARTATMLVSRVRVGAVQWLHTLSRRTFTVAEVTGGTLQGFDLVCSGQRRSLDYKPAAQWTIPAGWGQCVLGLRATEGTAFALVELAADAADNELANAKPLIVNTPPVLAAPAQERAPNARRAVPSRERENTEEALRFLKGRP